MTAVTITQITPPELEALINDAVNKAMANHLPTPPEPQPTGYISRAKACELLCTTPSTLHRWLREGRLQAFHIGGRTLFREEDVMKAVKPVSYGLKEKGGNR